MTRPVIIFAALALSAGCKGKEPDQRAPGGAGPKVVDLVTTDPSPPAPGANATIELPKAVRRLGELAGLAVGEPGFKGDMPTCCLDCDPMVPALRRIEGLVPSLTGPIGPTSLRAAAAEVRDHPWSELVSETYQDKPRLQFLAALASLADRLDATAANLGLDDDAARAHADELAGAVTKLLAAARALGEESKHYCVND